MAIRHDDDDYDWVFGRNLRQHSLRDEDYHVSSPQKDTLIELALTLGGFVGVILLISAALTALR